MLARVRSAAVLGIDVYLVDVETDIANGLSSFATSGYPGHGAGGARARLRRRRELGIHLSSEADDGLREKGARGVSPARADL